MPEITTNFTGNLTRAPELKFTSGGKAYCRFSVAVDRPLPPNGGDKKTDFVDVVCWEDIAEHVATSLDQRDRVIVIGKWEQSSWEKDGEKKTKWEVRANEVGPSLRWATTTVERVESSSAPARATAGARSNNRAAAPARRAVEDEEPF